MLKKTLFIIGGGAFLLILVFLFFEGRKDKKKIFIQRSPIVYSSYKSYDFSTLKDDEFFKGNWSGVFYGKKPYRKVRRKAKLVFFFERKATLILKLKYRFDSEENKLFKLFFNGEEIYSEELKPSDIKERAFFISKKRVKEGQNYIGFEGNVRVYDLEIYDKRLKKFKDKKGLIFPHAKLLFYFHPKKDDVFYIQFKKPVKKCELKVETSKRTIKKKISKKARIEYSLGEFAGKFVRVSLIVDNDKPFKILKSGYRRHIEISKEYKDYVEKFFKRAKKEFNLLYIILDSSRADHFHIYGYRRNTTPEIDKFFSNSLVFEKAFSEAAYTLASTATLFSGLEPELHNTLSDYYGGLPSTIETMAERFKKAEFFTGAVSAIPYCGKSFNMQQGFQRFVELFLKNKQPYGEEFLSPFKSMLKEASLRKKRFFIYLHVREPHIDYIMKPPFYGKFRKRFKEYPSEEYQVFIKNLYFRKPPFDKTIKKEDVKLLIDSYDENLLSSDYYVGRILETLKKEKLMEKTIVVLSGDHGEGLNEHGLIGHNVVLYNEGVHIPLLIKVPGVKGKILFNYPVSTSDVTMSMIEHFISEPEYKTFIKPKGLFFKDEFKTIIGRTIFFRDNYPLYYVLSGGKKAFINYIRHKRGVEIFDLEKDPFELKPFKKADKFSTEFFKFELYNYFISKKEGYITKRKKKLREKDIQSLKSLGYLGD